MPQKRLAVDLDEILHLEVYCDNCKTSTSLPIQSRSGGIPVTQNLMEAEYRCPFCQKNFRDTLGFQQAIDRLREGLLLARNHRSPFLVRLVIQKRERNRETQA